MKDVERLRRAVFDAYEQLRMGAEISAADGLIDEEEAKEVLDCADELLAAYREYTAGQP